MVVRARTTDVQKKPLTDGDGVLPTDEDYVMTTSRCSKAIKINLCCKSGVMAEILRNLGDECAPKFRETCFGHLLDFNVNKTSSQLLLHIVQRQCKARKTDELTFKFGGKFCKFGLRVFSLITGKFCKCGPVVKVDKSSIGGGWQLQREYFKDVDGVRRSMLSMTFRFNKRALVDGMVKISLLYCLECFLLAKQDKVIIEDEHILMVDEQEMFNAYPWGRVAYQVLISSVKSVRLSKGSSATGINGLVFALIASAYERRNENDDARVPKLGMMVETIVNRNPSHRHRDRPVLAEVNEDRPTKSAPASHDVHS